jgi:hypothetical protein
MVFPARQMIFDVIGDLITNERQRKQLVLDDRIVSPLRKFPIYGRVVPEAVRPIIHAEHSAVVLGVATIHGGASLNMLISYAADIGIRLVNTNLIAC